MMNPCAPKVNDGAKTDDRRQSLHILNGRFQLKKQNSVRFSGGDTSWQRNPSSRNLMVDQQKESYRNLLEATKKEIADPKNHRSVSFATTTMFDSSDKSNEDPASPVKKRVSKVAQMQAKLKSSLKSSSYGSGPPDDLDASWGGALGQELSLSSSEGDSEDEDSLGDFVPDMDASINFRAKAQQSMNFNMSFMNIGGEEDDEANLNDSGGLGASSRKMNASSRKQAAKRTGRGSIFVIADARFGQTKVVQTRLEKSAIKLQRFFRRCLLILRQFTDEREYLKNEIVDIESRRVEELNDVARYIEEEKEQFRMELEEEYNANLLSPEEWDAYHKEQEDTKKEIATLKEENEQLKKDCKELQRSNEKLSIVDPEREAEKRSLEIQVQKLELDERDWNNIKSTYEVAVAEAQRKLDLLEENQRVKRAHRKRMEDAIDKVIKLLEDNQSTENPKLVEKAQKLKAKREKKMKKLKAKTAMEQQGLIPTTVTVGDEGDEEQQQKLQEEEQRRAKRKSSRKQKQEAGDDLPALGSADAEEKKKSKDKRKSKKQQLDDSLPEMITIDPDNSEGADEAEDKATKKKKDKKKDKDKKDKKKDKDKDKKDKKGSDKKDKKGSPEDEKFLRMYEAEAKKKAGQKLESTGEGGPGALMAIITG